jgi:hypothetical protein
MVSTWTDIRKYDEICTKKKCMHQKLDEAFSRKKETR